MGGVRAVHDHRKPAHAGANPDSNANAHVHHYPGTVTDADAMAAFELITRTEGILPAIESAHGVAGALRLGRRLAQEQPDLRPLICVCLSGRGDKDVSTALSWFGLDGTPDQTVGGF